MKKNFIYLFIAIFSLGFMASCGDDDKEDDVTLAELLSKANGTYSGNLTINVLGSELDPIPAKIDVVKTSDDAVKFTITGLSVTIGPQTLAFKPIVIENVKAVKDGNKIKLSITDKQMSVGLIGVPEGTPDIPLKISIGSTVENNNMTTNVDVVVTEGTLEISVSAIFAGSK